MNRFYRVVLMGLCYVGGGASVAHAGDLADPQALYVQGEYDAAVTAASALNTADGYALAARSLLGKINLQLRSERQMKEIEQAVALAEKALELDPNNVEGHLQIATAYGFKGRMISMFSAKIAKLPEKSGYHLDRAIEIDPENAWGWSFAGARHWEIVRKGGPGMARALFGSTVEEGNLAFEKSLELGAQNPFIPYLYALTLLTSDVYANEARARELLNATAAITPASHQSEKTIERAEALLAALDSGDVKTTLKYVADYQGLKPLKAPKRRS